MKGEDTNRLYRHIFHCSYLTNKGMQEGALIPSLVKQVAVIFLVKKVTYKHCWENICWERIEQEWIISFVGLCNYYRESIAGAIGFKLFRLIHTHRKQKTRTD